MTYVSTVVLVGNEFQRMMFDERRVFDARLEVSESVAVGPMGDFAYAAGAYRFGVTPDRIALKHSSEEMILSDELEAAAGYVGTALQEQPAHGVRGIGLNVETRFDQRDGGTTGAEFCLGTIVGESLSTIVDGPLHFGCSRVIFFRGGLQYDLRLEPHFASNGANLSLQLNVHQNVAPEDELRSKLNHIAEIRTYVGDLCGRVAGAFDGECR